MEKAYAKVNVYLKVVGKREDGFHNLDSLMIPIDLCDDLYFYEDEDIIVESSIKDDIIYKVAKYMKERYNVLKGARIKVIKRIPIGAGLAGGSADCSAAIRGLNDFWDLRLKQTELDEISLIFGSDTLFCLHNKPAIVRGRGEQLEFVDYNNKRRILLVNPKYEVSTKKIFAEYKETDKGDNDLEGALLRLYPSIIDMKNEFLKDGIELKLSGSGPTYFSFVPDDYKIKENEKYLQLLQKIYY